jgi:site-specific recombinase XerD
MSDEPSSGLRAETPDRAASRHRVREAVTRLTDVMMQQRYSPRSIESYAAWLRRFLRYHQPRDATALHDGAVAEFLSALAIKGRVSASTQNQARSALVFYFRHVRGNPLPML